MKKSLQKILALLFIGCLLYSPNAQAISKLDFFTHAEEAGKRVQKVKQKWEEKYNKAMADLHEKVLKATGAEGAAIYDAFMEKNFKNLEEFGKNVKYQAMSGDFNLASNLKNLTKDYDKLKVEFEAASGAARNYAKSQAEERSKKEEEISKRLLELNAELKLPSTESDADRKEEIAKEIADLSAQKEELASGQARRNEQQEAAEKRAKEVGDKFLKVKNQLSELTMKEKMNKAVDSLFGESDEKEEQEETKELYAADINEFFLGKYEYQSSENISRVQKKRQKEFYAALLNLMKVVTENSVDSRTIYEKNVTYTDATTQVDGLFGGMSMKIGADIQKAKVAARYMELLLAEMRYNAMSEIIRWNDKYKLRDYKKDYSTLNLDDYILKKGNLLDDAKESITGGIQKGLDSWGGF